MERAEEQVKLGGWGGQEIEMMGGHDTGLLP